MTNKRIFDGKMPDALHGTLIRTARDGEFHPPLAADEYAVRGKYIVVGSVELFVRIREATGTKPRQCARRRAGQSGPVGETRADIRNLGRRD